MTSVGFESTIPVSERVKTLQALDRAGTIVRTIKREADGVLLLEALQVYR
jgi:hypothetical protein